MQESQNNVDARTQATLLDPRMATGGFIAAEAGTISGRISEAHIVQRCLQTGEAKAWE